MVLTIPGDASAGAPELRVEANPVYNLYHYLRTLAERRQPPAVPPPAKLARLAPQVRRQRLPRPLGVLWAPWEEAIAAAGSPAELRAAGPWRWRHSPRRLFALMVQGEEPYRRHVWPRHQQAIEAALDTIRQHLTPCYVAMFARQARLLRTAWPPSIAVHLVGDCYLAPGGYSHPLTVDVSANRGPQLIETILHEATHVMDLASSDPQRASAVLLRTLSPGRLKIRQGRGTWQVWHGLVYWSAGDAVRQFVDPGYEPYAVRHGLYRQFGARDDDNPYADPWRRYAAGDITLEEMARSIAGHLDRRTGAAGAVREPPLLRALLSLLPRRERRSRPWPSP